MEASIFIAGAAVAGILLWNSRTGAAVEDHAEGLGRPLPDRENGAVPCRPSLRAQRPSRLIESAVEAVKVALGFETERDGFQRSADALQEKRESSFATAGRALARIQRDIARKDDVTLTLATSSAPYKEALRRILESVEGEDSRELVTKRLQYHRQEALRDIATADELTASKMRLDDEGLPMKVRAAIANMAATGGAPLSLRMFRRRKVLVGFDRRSRRPAAPSNEADLVAPPTITHERPPSGTTHPELESVFAANDSVFSAGESVFALAEKEADGEYRPRPPADLAFPAPDDPSPGFEWSDDVEELSSSFDPADRLRAIELAVRSADPLVAPILKALSDPAAAVRRRAALELGRLDVQEAIPALDHAIEDPDESVRAAALEALSAMQDEAILPAIVGALKDESPEVRAAASAELLRRRSPGVVQMLGDALTSSALRGPALEVLTEMGSVAVDPIVDMLAGANGFRPALGAALSRVADPPRFVEELGMLDPSGRRRAVEALAVLGHGDQVARALLDPEPDIRARAAELLGDLGDERFRDDLARASYDPVPDVGAAGARAVERIDAGRRFVTAS